MGYGGSWVAVIEKYTFSFIVRYNREVQTEDKVEFFGTLQYHLVDTLFCKEVEADCTWTVPPEDMDNSPFKAPALFSMDDFLKVMNKSTRTTGKLSTIDVPECSEKMNFSTFRV